MTALLALKTSPSLSVVILLIYERKLVGTYYMHDMCYCVHNSCVCVCVCVWHNVQGFVLEK
jgi:hypothetical protein